MTKMQTETDYNAKMVRGYLRYLKLERSVSGNTLEAYHRDVEKLRFHPED